MKKKIAAVSSLWLNIFLFTFLSFQASSFGQEAEQHFFLGKLVKVKSAVLNEDRPVLIYLPEGYEQTQRKYPVMYLLDGGMHFHHASGITQFFGAKGLADPMIVVGVMNLDRTRDFSPTKIISRPTSGGADDFLAFLKTDLIPFIDKNYRTQPYRILFGHSLGGLFVVYALTTQPDAFNAYIAISPWLVYDNDYVVRKAEETLAGQLKSRRFLYIAAGNEPNLLPSIQKFSAVAEGAKLKNLEFKFESLEKEDHNTTPHLGLYSGLESLYSDWRMTTADIQAGSQGIKKHYQKLSDRFGYSIKPDFTDLYILGTSFLQQGNIKQAIDVFKLNAENNPNNWVAFSCLGEAYRMNNETQLAIKNYEKAVELNPDFAQGKDALKELKEKK